VIGSQTILHRKRAILQDRQIWTWNERFKQPRHCILLHSKVIYLMISKCNNAEVLQIQVMKIGMLQGMLNSFNRHTANICATTNSATEYVGTCTYRVDTQPFLHVDLWRGVLREGSVLFRSLRLK
jgi:hypothetical protein